MRLGLRRPGVLVAAVVLAGMAWALPGQATTNAGDSQRFEVASVRPVPPDKQGMFSISPWESDLFVARNISLRVLIAMAYGMDDHNVDGLADKVGDEMFDIEARVEGQQKLSYEHMQPLLQNLLRDRFHLAVHRGSRVGEGYALVVDKHGAKLTPSRATRGMPSILADEIFGQGISMEMLARPLGRPVEDRTGLTGTYDVTLHFRANDSENSELPSIFTALEEQLGVRAERAKVPVAILVVDHVDAEPTAQ